MTKEIVWQYDGVASCRQSWSFISFHISSARRLPNGNTLINEGEFGRMFQVTTNGEVVWEYVNPHFVTRMEPGHTGRPNAFNALFMVERNWAYRAQPVPYDWVPEDTPRSETRVTPPDLQHYRVTG